MSKNSLLKGEHTFKVCSPLTHHIGSVYPVKVTKWIDNETVRGQIDFEKLTTPQKILLL